MEAADASYAATYGRRYVAGYAAMEGQDDYTARTRGKDLESYQRLFKGQGKDEGHRAEDGRDGGRWSREPGPAARVRQRRRHEDCVTSAPRPKSPGGPLPTRPSRRPLATSPRSVRPSGNWPARSPRSAPASSPWSRPSETRSSAPSSRPTSIPRKPTPASPATSTTRTTTRLGSARSRSGGPRSAPREAGGGRDPATSSGARRRPASRSQGPPREGRRSAGQDRRAARAAARSRGLSLRARGAEPSRA